MSNLKTFGITLKAAKQIAIATHGHLPKCGNEMPLYHDKVEVTNLPGLWPPKKECDRTIWLQNISGHYQLRESIKWS